MEKFFEFLDDLRDAGVTNMFGALPYLQRAFPELVLDEMRAREVLTTWMASKSGAKQDG